MTERALILVLAGLVGVAASVPGQTADMVSQAQINFVNANGPLMERFEQANEALEGTQ